MESSDRALELVVSYSHKDEALEREFLVHLSPLRRQGIIRAWHDRDIGAGTEWKSEIDSHFETADIIVLLVSPDFINSDYCYDIEMQKALERHRAGECRVVPVFLRACDWKGAPFGTLQGLPDDAIPVVSSQWASRDDAFLKVAQGIRRVAEKLRATTPPKSQVTSPTGIDVPARQFVPEATVLTESIDDSGPGVLLNENYFEADAVIEKEQNSFEIRISPLSAEEEAELRSLRSDNRFQGSPVGFAHGNEGFIANVSTARIESTAGRRVWKIELSRRDPHQDGYSDVSYNNISADEVAEMRARLILLGEEPPAEARRAGVMVRSFSIGTTTQEFDPHIFPRLWAKVSGDIVKFLRFARLLAVFLLKTTSTCNDILELRLGPVLDEKLHVKFRGRRKLQWSTETITINVEGDCSLRFETSAPSRRKNR